MKTFRQTSKVWNTIIHVQAVLVFKSKKKKQEMFKCHSVANSLISILNIPINKLEILWHFIKRSKKDVAFDSFLKRS